MGRYRFAAWLTCLVAVTSLALGGAAGAAEEAAAEYTPEQLVAKYGPTVVLIAGHDEKGEVKSLGSGFLVTADGEIVTNYHVARGAYPATVKLTNGDIYDDISVIDYDARRDLAILKIKGFNLPVAELGNSDEVAQGARVVVIGNPMGLENSVSDGLWSGARDTGTGYKLQQMTAPISPGSSGGPVFDTRGRVIGVATLSLVEGQNLNFFVPINYARGLIGGKVKCSLKDLPEEKLGLEAAAAAGPTTTVETVKLLVDAVMDYYRGWDCNLEGWSRSYTSYVRDTPWDHDHPRTFVPAEVDPLVYQASELFFRALKEAAQAAKGTGEGADLARRYLDCIGRTAEGHEARVDNLINPADSFQAANQRYAAICSFAQRDADALGPELIKIVAAVAPELSTALPPGVSPQLPAIKPGEGRVGINLPYTSLEPRVTHVNRDSPAAKGGMRVGDVVLGVVNGPAFPTQNELLLYLRSHAGQRIVLRVQRGNKEAKLAIVPEPYVP